MLSPDPATEGVPYGAGSLGSLPRYAVAALITVVAILSQYFVPEWFPATLVVYESFVGGLLVVYGIPIVAFLLLVGARPLARWRHGGARALAPALGWYGALSLLSLLVTVVLVAVYTVVDPSALRLLEKPNPVVQAAASDPWFWIAFSFAVGAIEETIFRGWLFGYWLARGSRRSGLHAVWTSALFAGVHLYYGTTYGAAAPLVYPELFLLGLAFALAVRASGGNLVWVALLHGANDATAFLTLVNPSVALGLHYGVILVGGAVALYLATQGPRGTPTPWLPPPPGPAPPRPTGAGSPYPPLAISLSPPLPPPPPSWPAPPPPPPPPPGGPPGS